MELIPIVQQSLILFTGLLLLVIAISFIMSKIKGSSAVVQKESITDPVFMVQPPVYDHAHASAGYYYGQAQGQYETGQYSQAQPAEYATGFEAYPVERKKEFVTRTNRFTVINDMTPQRENPGLSERNFTFSRNFPGQN
ncbi:MAG: hypothetical protein ACM3RX_03345 [Methanococcaceae archaeon]